MVNRFNKICFVSYCKIYLHSHESPRNGINKIINKAWILLIEQKSKVSKKQIIK